MTHNQMMVKASNEGKQAKIEGKDVNSNPYHVGRETAYQQAWLASYIQTK